MKNSDFISSGTKKNLQDDSKMPTKIHDIREDGIKGDPFTHSANKEIKHELRGVGHKEAKRDADLHSDNTDLSDKDSGGFSSKNTGVKGDPLTKSGDKQVC